MDIDPHGPPLSLFVGRHMAYTPKPKKNENDDERRAREINDAADAQLRAEFEADEQSRAMTPTLTLIEFLRRMKRADS